MKVVSNIIDLDMDKVKLLMLINKLFLKEPLNMMNNLKENNILTVQFYMKENSLKIKQVRVSSTIKMENIMDNYYHKLSVEMEKVLWNGKVIKN